MSTFCWFECFSTKANRYFIKHTNAGLVFFYEIFKFFQKSYFHELFFYNWSCFLRCLFLGYLDLPYQFGILRMSTFCLLDWFFTKSNTYHMMLTNSSELFCASNFFTKNVFSQKKFFCSIIFSGSIFWNIRTCLTNLEFLGCLFFADLNDFTLALTEFA